LICYFRFRSFGFGFCWRRIFPVFRFFLFRRMVAGFADWSRSVQSVFDRLKHLNKKIYFDRLKHLNKIESFSYFYNLNVNWNTLASAQLFQSTIKLVSSYSEQIVFFFSFLQNRWKNTWNKGWTLLHLQNNAWTDLWNVKLQY
jgi:hypothetical protein